MSLLKSLTEWFDSLQKKVETLREKEAHQSVTKAEAKSSEKEADDRGRATLSKNSGPSVTKEHHSLCHHFSEQSDVQRHQQFCFCSTSNPSQLRSQSPQEKYSDQKRKSPACGFPKPMTHNWADHVSYSEGESMNYAKSITFRALEAEDYQHFKVAEV